MRSLSLSLGLLLVALGLSSCVFQLPVSSNSGGLLMAQLPADKYTILGTSSGESCSRYILGYPLSPVTGEKSTYQAAVRKAIQSKNGDYFIQSTSDFQYTGFPSAYYMAWYQELCVTVEGLVIKFK